MDQRARADDFVSPCVVLVAAMSAAVVRTATVVAAAVSTVVVLVIVVVALDIGVIAEIVRKIRLDRCIARAAYTAVELDARLCKSHLCATANASADENVSTECLQKSRKCSVTASVCVRDLGGNDLTVFYSVDLKLLGVSEVLKDLSVFISNCNFHIFILLRL